MESWKLVLLITIISSYCCSYGVCQQSCNEVGAVAGLSTSIQCNENHNEAPFWFINGTVYELFSIPRHFPFIPVVDSYIELNIPTVPLTVDQTTFQCARFSENGLDNETCITLTVFSNPGNISEGNINVVGELVINYQELVFLESMTTVSWFLNDTCSESVVVQRYTLDTGEPVLVPDHIFATASSSDHSVVISGPHSGISYKLLGRNESGHECPSAQNIYYRFDDTVEMWLLNFTVSPSLCYLIPQTDVCSSGLNFVWASREAGRSCVCPAHNSSAGRWVFESCVEGCRDAVLTPVLTEQGSICIFNLTSSLNGSLFHFVCSTEPCDSSGVDCFLQTVISSFIIISDSTTTEDRTDSTTANFASSSVYIASSAVTVAESTEGSYQLIIIISAGMSALFILLLMFLSIVVLCHCYLKKNHGSLTFNTKRRRRTASTKKTAYNTNYISITLPRAVDGQQSNHDQQLQVETTSPLYEMIPGETKTTNINQDSSDEQQCPNLTTVSENLPYLNDQERFEQEDFSTHGQLYDTVADIASGSKKPNESIYNCLNHNLPNTEVGANPNRSQNGNTPREINNQMDGTLDGLDGDMGHEAMYSTLDGITEHSKYPMGDTQGAHITAENGTVKEKASARPVYSVVNKALKKKNHHTLPNDLIECQVVVNKDQAETGLKLLASDIS